MQYQEIEPLSQRVYSIILIIYLLHIYHTILKTKIYKIIYTWNNIDKTNSIPTSITKCNTELSPSRTTDNMFYIMLSKLQLIHQYKNYSLESSIRFFRSVSSKNIYIKTNDYCNFSKNEIEILSLSLSLSLSVEYQYSIFHFLCTCIYKSKNQRLDILSVINIMFLFPNIQNLIAVYIVLNEIPSHISTKCAIVQCARMAERREVLKLITTLVQRRERMAVSDQISYSSNYMY